MPKASNPRRKKAAKRAKSPAPGGGLRQSSRTTRAPRRADESVSYALSGPSTSAGAANVAVASEAQGATGSAIMEPPAAASVVASEDAGAPTTDTGDNSEEEDEDPAADLLQHLNNVAASTGIPMLNTPLPVTTIVAALGQLNPNVFQSSALAQQITNPQPPAGTPSPVGPPAPTAVPIHVGPSAPTLAQAPTVQVAPAPAATQVLAVASIAPTPATLTVTPAAAPVAPPPIQRLAASGTAPAPVMNAPVAALPATIAPPTVALPAAQPNATQLFLQSVYGARICSVQLMRSPVIGHVARSYMTYNVVTDVLSRSGVPLPSTPPHTVVDANGTAIQITNADVLSVFDITLTTLRAFKTDANKMERAYKILLRRRTLQTLTVAEEDLLVLLEAICAHDRFIYRADVDALLTGFREQTLDAATLSALDLCGRPFMSLIATV